MKPLTQLNKPIMALTVGILGGLTGVIAVVSQPTGTCEIRDRQAIPITSPGPGRGLILALSLAQVGLSVVSYRKSKGSQGLVPQSEGPIPTETVGPISSGLIAEKPSRVEGSFPEVESLVEGPILIQPGPMTLERALEESPLKGALEFGCLMLYGGQGSGKTTLASALLRYRLLKGHEVRVMNPHYSYGMYKPLRVYGVGDSQEDTWLSIQEGIHWLLDEVKARYKVMRNQPQSEWEFLGQPITVLVEELGLYAANLDKELMAKFLKTCLTEVRKANIYVIGVSQAPTQAMTGGVKGIYSLMRTSSAEVTLESVPNTKLPGGRGPSGYGTIEIPGQDMMRFKVPNIPSLISGELWNFTDLVGKEA